ncbi:MAG TPA: nitroreductase, partial [Planctomycetaceae bacterium]|nr:nitroreductase [Planctomycetaceae bacterium]
MSQLQFAVADDKCIRCDACVKDCPVHIIQRSDSLPNIAGTSEGQCIRCQHCLAVCPTGAISICGLKPENSLPITSGSFPSYEQMKVYVRGRRSVRQFKHENVPVAVIENLLADIAHAPTGCNDCDLTFSVVDDRKDIERLREQVVSAVEKETSLDDTDFLRQAATVYRRDGTDHFFRGAPHLLIVSPGSRAHSGREDAVLALAYFELLARTAGVGTTWCG